MKILQLHNHYKQVNFNIIRQLGFFKWGSGKNDKKCTPKPNPNPLDVCTKEAQAVLDVSCDSDVVKCDCQTPKVIIIGAGMAGLSAACHLLCRGITDVTILEASCRPGGRIFSCWLGDVTVEFGPSFIEGASIANPIFTLARLAGIVSPNSAVQPSECSVFLTRDGRTISEFRLEELIFQHIICQAKKLPVQHDLQMRSNLLQFISLRIQQELLQFPAALRYDAERILFGLVNSLKASIGADLKNVSAYHLGNLKCVPGGRVYPNTGFNSILTPLLKNIPEKCFVFNRQACKIKMVKEPKPKSRVVVQDCDHKEYYADYVIVTLPLGVLKEISESLFDEEDISEDKLEAIKKIGVGVTNKVFLEYANPWWCSGGGNINLAWSGDELSFRQDWTKGIGAIKEAPGSKQVLSVLVGGCEALTLEKANETEIAIEFTRFLRKFTGDSSIPYPSNILMSRWCSNPIYMGSTVYMNTETRVGHFLTLGGYGQCSQDGRPEAILFAGDGVIPEYFGTILGARKSGIRQADRIIKATMRECEKKKELDKCRNLLKQLKCSEKKTDCSCG